MYREREGERERDIVSYDIMLYDISVIVIIIISCVIIIIIVAIVIIVIIVIIVFVIIMLIISRHRRRRTSDAVGPSEVEERWAQSAHRLGRHLFSSKTGKCGFHALRYQLRLADLRL